MQGFGKGSHHVEPWLFHYQHFAWNGCTRRTSCSRIRIGIGIAILILQKVQMEHAIVTQTNGTIATVGIFSIIFTLDILMVGMHIGFRIGSLAFWLTMSSTSYMCFWKDTTLIRQWFGQVNNAKCSKGTLYIKIIFLFCCWKKEAPLDVRQSMNMWTVTIPTNSGNINPAVGRAKTGRLFYSGKE